MAFYGVQLGKSTHQIIVFKPESKASETWLLTWSFEALSYPFCAKANVVRDIEIRQRDLSIVTELFHDQMDARIF